MQIYPRPAAMTFAVVSVLSLLVVCAEASDSKNASVQASAALHSASAKKEIAASQHSAPTKPHDLAALQRASQPSLHHDAKEGHFLNKKQLEPIMSVRCLKEKQIHPDRPCYGPENGDDMHRGPISIGNYPDYRDMRCHANHEFFCDPDQVLRGEQQVAVQQRLQHFKETTLVNCGQMQKAMDPDVKRRWFEKEYPVYQNRLALEDYRPFNLAVVVADSWPSSEADPKSMEYFGRVLMSQWGLHPIYNGVDNGNGVNQVYSWGEYHENCPTAALLVIMPKLHQIYLTSPNCEFICESRGGPEVISAALRGLDRGGVEEAILAAVDTVDKVLKVTTPLSLQEAPVKTRARRSVTGQVVGSDASWVWAMRLLYAGIVIVFVISVSAFVYYVLLPQKYRSAPRWNTTALVQQGSDASRLAVREAMMTR